MPSKANEREDTDMIYRKEGYHHTLTVERSAISEGVTVAVDLHGALVRDEEIPALVSALQAYMSKKAKEIAGQSR
jgi:hypothetical protein